MLTLKQTRYATLGYLWSWLSNHIERAWMQFADDALIIANNDKNAQVMINVFTVWCKWADMLIRIDKCSTFGMRKEKATYLQYLPNVFIDGTQIPQIGLDLDFVYLGKYFNFGMNQIQARRDVTEKLSHLLSRIIHLLIKPQTKLTEFLNLQFSQN